MPTAAQLIQRAAYVAGIVPDEQAMLPYISDRGLEIFNDILAEFSGADVTIPYQSVITFNTVIGQESYTSGVGAYDINGNQIMDIIDCYATKNNVRYPMSFMNEKMYRNIPYPTSQGIPAMMFLRKFPTYSQIFFQPTPVDTFVVTLICKQQMSQVVATTDLTPIPPSWLLGFKFMIARDYRLYYKLPADQDLLARAQAAKKDMMATNVVDVIVEKTEIISRSRFYYPYILGFF